MPTILRIGPYRFYFYSHEPNEPPHVHVDKDGYSAKFWLRKISLAGSAGFAKNELKELERIVNKHQQHLLDKWYEYFGE